MVCGGLNVKNYRRRESCGDGGIPTCDEVA